MNITPQQKRKLDRLAEVGKKGSMAILKYIFDFESDVEEKMKSIEEKIPSLNKLAESLKGVKGDKGDIPIPGVDFPLPKDGTNGADGISPDKNEIAREVLSLIPIPKDGLNGISPDKEEIIQEVISLLPPAQNGSDGKDGENGSPDTPRDIVQKLNSLKEAVSPSVIIGLPELERMVVATLASLPVTTSFFNGLRAKNLTINGATARQVGDTVIMTVAASSGGHVIQDEGVPLTQRTNLNFAGAGVTVTDDAGNDATKVTISTSAGAGFQQPTSGAVNGANISFDWATAPNVISVDGRTIQKTSSDGTVNWSGTTITTLTIAPNFDIFGIA